MATPPGPLIICKSDEEGQYIDIEGLTELVQTYGSDTCEEHLQACKEEVEKTENYEERQLQPGRAYIHPGFEGDLRLEVSGKSKLNDMKLKAIMIQCFGVRLYCDNCDVLGGLEDETKAPFEFCKAVLVYEYLADIPDDFYFYGSCGNCVWYGFDAKKCREEMPDLREVNDSIASDWNPDSTFW